MLMRGKAWAKRTKGCIKKCEGRRAGREGRKV